MKHFFLEKSGYRTISNNSYTLLIRTPPFPEKDANFCTVHVKIIILLFVQQKCKHNEMAFLTSRNASKHVLWLLVSIVPPGEIHQDSDLVLQAKPIAVSCETRVRYCQASQDVKQMLWGLPLKCSCSLMAQRY